LGTLSARLLADHPYQFQGRFERVDVARWFAAVPSLSTRVAGTASATLTLTAHGVGRANLVRSMEGEGRLDARNVELSGMDFASLISGDARLLPAGRVRARKFPHWWRRNRGGGFRPGQFERPFQAGGRIIFLSAELRIHPSIFMPQQTGKRPRQVLCWAAPSSPERWPSASVSESAAKSAPARDSIAMRQGSVCPSSFG